MIAKVTSLEKIKKKKIIKEKKVRQVTKQKAVFEDVYIPPEYYCGRCHRSYKHGDNPNQPDKCPRCVCVNSRCNHDSIMHRPLTINGTSVYRCLPCWYWEEQRKVSYLKGWNYQSHIAPRTAGRTEKRAKQVDYTVIEEYEEEKEITVEETVEKLIDKENIAFTHTNNVITNHFRDYKDFVDRYLTLDKYFKDTELLKYEKWYGSKSHQHVLELLRYHNQKEKVIITSIVPPEYNELIVGEKQTLVEFPSVVGFYPNVPAYIQGHPLNMYNNYREYRPDIEKSINIYFNATMDSKNYENQYKNRGIICYSLIDYLINEEKVKVNLKLLDISFIQGEILVQTIDFDYETIQNDQEMVYNFLTTSSVMRVMMLEYKASMVKLKQIGRSWLDGFGYSMENQHVRSVLNLNDNDILFGTPDELNIAGFDLEDDFYRSMEMLGLIYTYYSEVDASVYSDVRNEKIQDIKEFLNKRGVTKLIHFTSEDNIDSIKKHGILSREILSHRKIDFDYNDHQRLEKCLDAISLSVSSPNRLLIDEFIKRYPGKRFKILEIDPRILYEMKTNNKPIKRLYCDYNAASRYAQKSEIDMSIMFKNEICKRHIVHNRINRKDHEPTSDQAEILFFGDIPYPYILNIIDYDHQ